MNSSIPTASVVMAVYNGEKYLRPTIECMLAQTFNNFEFVIVNDGSQDDTRQIISSYNDPRIVLHDNQINLGQTKSLNVGLNLAKGKYIARIDAGDISLPERLEKQIAYMDQNSEIAVLGTSAIQYDESGKIIGIVHMPESVELMRQRIIFASPVVHISVLMRRDPVLKIGGYDDKFHVLADYDLWSRLLINGYLIANIRNILAGYMVSPQSFGNINAMNRSVGEATEIIHSSVKKMTHHVISRDEARSIYRMFTFDSDDLPFEQIKSTENIFKDILVDMGASSREINYYLFRKNLRHLLRNLKNALQKPRSQYALYSCIKQSFGVFLSHLAHDDLKQKLTNLIWRSKKSSSFSRHLISFQSSNE